MASQRIWLHYTIRAVKRKQLCLLGQGLACKLFEKLGMPICIQHKKQPRKSPGGRKTVNPPYGSDHTEDLLMSNL